MVKAPGGWVVYVSIKDDHYIREKRKWRQKLSTLHPDKGGKAWRFRNVMLRYLAWRNKQVREYEELGLTTPDRARFVNTATAPRSVQKLIEVGDGEES